MKNIIRRLLGKKDKTSLKIKDNVVLKTPAYTNRYQNRDFLILATGPSLHQSQNTISKFIEEYDPIVMGGNFLGDGYIPHYHAFVNRNRFQNYAYSINPKSKVLLSPYFPDWIVKKQYQGEYEEIQFYNKYPSVNGSIQLSNGIIYAEGGTIATILISVALVMGAKNIFIAGMDGYSQTKQTHHYQEKDDKEQEDLIIQENSMKKQLNCIQNYMESHHLGQLSIITPTVYKAFFKSINLF
jgi:4-hydroxy 2-oxovalerate aldolase